MDERLKVPAIVHHSGDLTGFVAEVSAPAVVEEIPPGLVSPPPQSHTGRSLQPRSLRLGGLHQSQLEQPQCVEPVDCGGVKLPVGVSQSVSQSCSAEETFPHPLLGTPGTLLTTDY